MIELKTIEDIEAIITDVRFLALFRAFVKAIDSKDYKIARKLTILRYLIGKLDQYEYLLNFAYKSVFKVLEERDYFYWERKMLLECLNR